MSAADEIFQDVPAELEESWRHGGLIGGMSELAMREPGALARSFKRAGDTLLAASLAAGSVDELIYPVLFNYRHSIELYLKAIVDPTQRNHDLNGLIGQFQRAVFERLSVEVPAWILERLGEFHDVDGRSVTFRYPEAGVVSQGARFSGEAWVDFHRLKRSMDGLETAFARVLAKLTLP
jgi:hypothetical protein